MVKAHICIAKSATSRFFERGQQDGERQRPAGAGGDGHRRRDPQAPAQQRHRDRGADDAGRSGPHGQSKRG